MNLTDNTLSQPLAPALYLFPSNLSDAPVTDVLPRRNIELIARVKYFIVENVRTARRFLKKCDRDIDIDTLTFYTLNVNTDPTEVAAMLEPLSQGHAIGVISEAGCPAVADPGALAVERARGMGYHIVPLVGPSSILLALMASGFNGQSFAFNGYLPIDAAKRSEALKRLHRLTVKERQTQIFIETPYRNNRLIGEIAATLPPATMLCVASDLTGPAERIVTLPLSQWKKLTPDFDKTPAIFLLFS